MMIVEIFPEKILIIACQSAIATCTISTPLMDFTEASLDFLYIKISGSSSVIFP
ncbi:MAG: hypothetical protein GF311_23750 [Candidatus Lokiarchaeota archaeon]|nr:hypothetical protein [Candidatus Lokiarchaeota archaeon]